MDHPCLHFSHQLTFKSCSLSLRSCRTPAWQFLHASVCKPDSIIVLTASLYSFPPLHSFFTLFHHAGLLTWSISNPSPCSSLFIPLLSKLYFHLFSISSTCSHYRHVFAMSSMSLMLSLLLYTWTLCSRVCLKTSFSIHYLTTKMRWEVCSIFKELVIKLERQEHISVTFAVSLKCVRPHFR